MNAARRKSIASIVEALQLLSARIEEIKDEEQDGFENLPESFQDSDRGRAMEEAAEALEYAQGGVDEAVENLEGIE